MTIDEMIAVLKAAKEGKVIQGRVKDGGAWGDCATPIWDFWRNEYRVKPTHREVYVLKEDTHPREEAVWSTTMITPEQWERLTPEDQTRWTRFVEAES